MRVDIQTHFLPEEYLDTLRDLGRSVTVEQRDDHLFIEHEHDSFPLYPGFTDLETRIEWMDAHDIDVGLVSVSKPSPNEGPFSVEESVELAKALNDGYAAARDAYPDRISGLASLPLRDPEAALAEVDRVANDLELAGVGLHTTVGGKQLSHPDFEPVFDRMDELGLNAFIHPRYNRLTEDLSEAEWMLKPMVIFPTETTLQVSRLIFSGFFDRHDFDVVLAHLGGAIPYLVGRLKTARRIGQERFEEGHSNIPERPIEEYVEEFYYDAIAHHPPALRAAIDTVGADRLLFATDYPFEAEDAAGTVEDLQELELTDEEYDAIMGETAADLFDF
jgi:aminocarboxymuconate-semialdehyde decarboxylase